MITRRKIINTNVCVFVCFFVMCFFLNFRLVTYNSTNLQLFFFYFPGDVVTQKKNVGSTILLCFIFVPLAVATIPESLSLSERGPHANLQNLSLFVFFLETDWVYRLLRFVLFCYWDMSIASGKETIEKLKNGSEN